MSRPGSVKIYLCCLAVVLSSYFGSCRKKEEPPEEIIAWVNQQKITLSEFRSFYELDPNFGIDSTGFTALGYELNKMIGHKLAYGKADQKGFLKDSMVVKIYNWELSRAMLRELYREVAEAKVQVSEEELRKLFLESATLVHVRHLFSKDSLQLLSWREKVQAGTPFEKLSPIAFQDTFLAKNGGDLGWTKIDDLDSEFAKAVKALSKGEISGIVRTKWGYHLIQLVDRTDEVLFSEDQFHKQKKLLSKKLATRKAQELARKYVTDYIGKLNPQPKPVVFQKLWAAVARDAGLETRLSEAVMFTNELIEQLKFLLKEDLGRTLISYKGGSISLGEYLASLREVPISNRPRIRTRGDLSQKMALWIRDELLLQEAFQRKLNHRSRVTEEVVESMEKQIYLFYLQEEVGNIEIPSAVKNYFDQPQKGIHPSLSKFHTLQEWIWWQAELSLNEKLKSFATEVEIDSLLLQKENQQIDWQRNVRMFAFPNPQ